ncbi:indole-3-glycerol phosphate synthase TrpC [Clostridium sp. MD294]|uniref:indole-3-glycerol phosphate synthase TrpC n=1 Tax=Clostridium sp. MD294 TaxID=97138 RepID=UPI0002CA0629|nr:indole-3-glycerol phosphate synthase TrpC [Clostridium sp. MD294]USF29252.1 Indole-3-glycerol phosphate synthase [Clostridium sp. MD294]
MENILEVIVKTTRTRITEEQRICPLVELKQKAEAMNANTGFPFYKALQSKNMAFICEVKKASPSKGIISEEFDFINIAKQYEKAGANAISCLTEPYYFLGRDEHLKQISENVSIPILRKDFTVSEYMIYQAKLLGASAILLVCSILKEGQLQEYLELAHSLGLSALVEARTAEEVKKAVEVGAKIIGINNRDLESFRIDMTQSQQLRNLVPDSCIFVSESGIQTPEDVIKLKQIGTNAVLVGEVLMKAENKEQTLKLLRGEA